MKAVDNRAYKDDISGIKVATVLKVAGDVLKPDAVSNGGWVNSEDYRSDA